MAHQRIMLSLVYDEKRRLRAEIARQRRAIDASRRGLRREAGELVSWRTYVRRFPLAAVGLAAGLGWVVAWGLPQRAAGKMLGGLVLKAGLGLASARLWHEVQSIVFDSLTPPTPRK